MSARTDPPRAAFDPQVAFRRAVALQTKGHVAEAADIYRTLLRYDPQHFGTLYNLAAALDSADQPEEAERLLEKAIRREPGSAAAYTLLARVLQHLDRYDEASKRARRAIALNPRYAEAYTILAQGLAEIGCYDEARHAMAQAIDLAPDRPGSYYQWGFMSRWTADDPRLAGLKSLAANLASLPVDQQVLVHFALGKAYQDCGDPERAMRHQITGGALQRRILGYDEVTTLREMDERGRAFDADWMHQHLQGGDPSTLPVFILGMPRSGTTLVEQILASHPKVHALGERAYLEKAMTEIEAARGLGHLPSAAAKWSNEELHRLGSRYLEMARRGVPEAATRITDKLPDNFRHVGIIRAALPNAHIIHTRRDPIDTCLSMFSILFSGNGVPFSYDLSDLGHYYRAYERMMDHWRTVLPADAMLEVRYEEVVENVEEQARRVIAFCGLDWDDACLAFHRSDRPVRTSSHAQVRAPIYRDAIGRPRASRDLLMPLLTALGTN